MYISMTTYMRELRLAHALNDKPYLQHLIYDYLFGDDYVIMLRTVIGEDPGYVNGRAA